MSAVCFTDISILYFGEIKYCIPIVVKDENLLERNITLLSEIIFETNKHLEYYCTQYNIRNNESLKKTFRLCKQNTYG